MDIKFYCFRIVSIDSVWSHFMFCSKIVRIHLVWLESISYNSRPRPRLTSTKRHISIFVTRQNKWCTQMIFWCASSSFFAPIKFKATLLGPVFRQKVHWQDGPDISFLLACWIRHLFIDKSCTGRSKCPGHLAGFPVIAEIPCSAPPYRSYRGTGGAPCFFFNAHLP